MSVEKISLLEHHIPIIQDGVRLHQWGGYSIEALAWEKVHVLKDRHRYPFLNQGQMETFAAAFLQILTAAANGAEIIGIPENTNEGDAICQACPKYAETCWHGHPEYLFTPNHTPLSSPKKTWAPFSIDIQASGELSEAEFEALVYNLAQVHKFRADCLKVVFIPAHLRPPGISAGYLVEEKPERTTVIWQYCNDLINGINKRHPYSDVLVCASDTHEGTSLRPAHYRTHMDRGFRRMFG
jgi:hypothetical protein